MESSKQTTLMAFNKKVKSPYAMQYLQFQQRLKGGRKGKGKGKLPQIPSTSMVKKTALLPHTLQDDYLQMAHNLINNRNKLWFADEKENLPTLTIDHGEEVIANIKQKIARMKNYSQQTHLHPPRPPMQHSQQLTRPHVISEVSTKSTPGVPEGLKIVPKQDGSASVEGGIRSRVHSEALRPSSSGRGGQVVTFLQYKKSKRQLSIRMRKEGS